jgi:hypothetical protein
MTNNQIILKLVSKSDYRFLYNLLKERDSRTNISHKKMPTFNEHIKFIKSKPYTKWYIVKYGAQKIASIYLTSQNEIGIFVSPKNKTSENFFKSYGFKFIQKTYELTQN